MESRKLCAVIVSVFKSKDFIETCINSIKDQEPLEGWDYELRVGVDGCFQAARALIKLKQDYYWSGTNHGPYVIRNSLIMQKPADAYAIFDADDKMMPTYLKTLIPMAYPDSIAGAGRRDMNRVGHSASKRVKDYGVGVCVISHNAWERLGGYRDWRIAADHDLIQRARKIGVPVNACGDALYFRRRHQQSLTNAKGTSTSSALRRSIKRKSKVLLKKGDIEVVPKVVPLEYRG